MFCLQEMGYEVDSIAFYETSTNKMIPVDYPGDKEIREFEDFLKRFHAYNPNDDISVNPNKCIHCIYCNLCDKTTRNNVY